jgi:hypothetical protein
MQTTYFWNKLHLQGQKIRLTGLAVLAFFLLPHLAQAQRQYWFESSSSSPRYADDAGPSIRKNKRRINKPVAFGFYGGVVRSSFNLKYTDEFAATRAGSTGFDPNVLVKAINPKSSLGFALGLYSNVRLGEFWDVRLQANAAFYERKLEYVPLNGASETQVIESAMLEVPIMLKYRSQLRGISNMYLLAGVKPSIALSSKKASEDAIITNATDVTIEYGLGFDTFFPFFKFSPEIRFSHGLLNALNKSNNEFGLDKPIQRLTTHTASLYFYFGG